MKYLDKAGLSRLWANLKPKLTGKEDKSNKVTSITSSSTDIQYPSAKAVYNALQNNSGSSAVLINSTESETSIVNKLYSLINDDYSYKQPGIFIEDEHMSSDVICTIFYFATIQKLDDSTDIFGFLGNAGFKIFTVDKNTHTFTTMNAYYSDIFENAGNKVTTISSSSSDDEYPSAKAVYNALQSIGAHIYSTEETVIGKWIDGKPLYRKVVSLSGLVSGDNDISCNNESIDTLVDVYGNLKFDGSGSGWQPIVRTHLTNFSGFGLGIGNIRTTNFKVTIGSYYGSFIKGHVIFEYTKTTD